MTLIDPSAQTSENDSELQNVRTRDQLISDYRGLAMSIARSRCHRQAEREDVEQVAMMALIKAADRFDPARNVLFTTFAWATIDGEIKRFFRDYSSAIHIARPLRESAARVSTSVEELTNLLGRSPTIEELAEHAGYSVETVIESLEMLRNIRPASLESMGSDDESAFEIAEVDSGFDVADDRQLLWSYIQHLPQRERQILALRFVEQRSQAEIGALLSISQMHVSRLLNRSLSTLRKLAVLRGEAEAR